MTFDEARERTLAKLVLAFGGLRRILDDATLVNPDYPPLKGALRGIEEQTLALVRINVVEREAAEER